VNDALARLERVIAAELLYAPAHAAFGVRFVRAETGVSVARMPVVGALEDGGRTLAAGGLLVLFDALLGSSVASALPAGSAMTTLTMHLQFTDLRHPGGEWLQGTGRRVALDGLSALSTAEVTAADGRLVAIGSSRCVVLPDAATAPMAEPGDGQPLGELGAWRRAVVVEPVGGGARGRARADAGWANPRGHVQGGAVAMIAERTLHELWRPHDLDAADCFDLDITFLRALPSDGREITCRGTLAHRGRSLGTARAEVLDADRVVAEIGASRYHRST
jgi:acyl-coenzyme A thioesterase PaaI-like protein